MTFPELPLALRYTLNLRVITHVNLFGKFISYHDSQLSVSDLGYTF